VHVGITGVMDRLEGGAASNERLVGLAHLRGLGVCGEHGAVFVEVGHPNSMRNGYSVQLLLLCPFLFLPQVERIQAGMFQSFQQGLFLFVLVALTVHEAEGVVSGDEFGQVFVVELVVVELAAFSGHDSFDVFELELNVLI